MVKATIEVDAQTRDALKKLKNELGLKNMDEVINHLMSPHSASREEAASSSSEDGGGEAPQKKRKKHVREPLFSFEDLAERHEMLEYYTGFDESAIRLLIRRLGEVGKPFFFSFFFLFSSPATMLRFYATKPPCFFR
jgi:hypothetical protein